MLVLAGSGPTRQLNANLVADIRRAGGRAELIDTNPDASLYNLPPVPGIGLPLLEILPIQMTALALAIRNQHIPGQFAHGAKITVVE
mgnify:CR=1 FL=1